MRKYRDRKFLPYTEEQMFGLVADVERYPEFLPWCDGLVVTSRVVDGDRETLIATMTVSFKVYTERFKTEVKLDRAARTISVRYLDGPFRRLENEWRFAPQQGGTMVDFYIAYEFRSAALQMLVGFFFDEAFRRLVGAFDARARALYGRRSASAGA